MHLITLKKKQTLAGLTRMMVIGNLVAFKSLGKLLLDVGLMLAYHCDRYGILIMLHIRFYVEKYIESRCINFSVVSMICSFKIGCQ